MDDSEDAATREVLARAEASPEDFVLKPQREGGGNNLYGPQILERLSQRRGLAAYILMQRIRPPINRHACDLVKLVFLTYSIRKVVLYTAA